MIKEFLISFMFLHQINAEDADYFQYFDECIQEKGEVLSNGKVCIPKEYKEWMQYRPIARNMKTKLSITLSNIQIIEIGTNEITISMNKRIKWADYRLTFGVAKVLLSVEDQKQIWSPKIIIGTNLISETKKAEEIDVVFWNLKHSLLKTFNLITTVRCEMNFLTFPFDSQTCNIEVSMIFIHFYKLLGIT